MSEIKVNSIKGVGANSAAITVNNTDGTCSANITSLNSGQFSNRNILINGEHLISQRNTSFSIAHDSSGNTYTTDRWQILQAGLGEYDSTVTQDSTVPDGFGKSFKVLTGTAESALGASDLIRLTVDIEGQDLQRLAKGTSAAKQTTLSFYVRSSITGTYTVAIYHWNVNRQVTGTYTINSANTWERKTITFPADTTGAITNDNTRQFRINFMLAAGSNYTSGGNSQTWDTYADNKFCYGHTAQTHTTAGATWYMTGCQYETGSVATDFEHRSFAQELALCQRYCYVITVQNGDNTGIVGQVLNSSTARGIIYFPVPMRDEPTYTGSATLCRYEAADSSDDFNFSALVLHRTPTQRPVSFTGMSQGLASNSMTGGQAFLVIARANSGKLTYDAEL